MIGASQLKRAQGVARRSVYIAVATFCLCVSVSAQSRTIFMTGDELRAVCQDRSDVCLGYVTAIADALESFKPPLPSTCRTNAVELQTVVALATDTLDSPGTDLRRPAINILADAFVGKWPC